MSEEIKKTKKKKSSNKTVKKQQPKKVKDDKKEEKKVVEKKNTNKKINTSKKQVKEKKIKKEEIKIEEKVEVKEKEQEKEIIKEEEVLINKEVVTKKTKKKNKNKNHILLIVLGCIILFLIFACVIVRKWYLPSESYSFDYLNIRTIGYDKDESQSNKLVSEDDKCIITVTSEIIDDIDLNELGTIEEIKDREWARQDFANGVTWLTHHKNMLYIVQMYANDNDTYEDVCKKDFDKIKKTFSFLKDE